MLKKITQVVDGIAIVSTTEFSQMIEQLIEEGIRKHLRSELSSIKKEGEENRLVTTGEACELLNISRVTFEKLTREKIIPRVPVGNASFRYNYSDLKPYIKAKSIL
ncbi:excisionase family DNA-binding protein [Pollutibacter soli]|uniref:excisionase family DNA-binding protein n=1 Tax=Pollutibacter soli TaxID=3034157 RepID=UPI003013C964